MTAPADLKALADGFRTEMRMRTEPVAVRMLQTAAELADSKARILKPTAVCQMIAWSRYRVEGGAVAASAEGVKCLWACSCLGMMRTPPRLEEGDLNRFFTRDKEAAENLQRAIFAIGNGEKRYAGLMTAPLAGADFVPDAIVLYVTPGQVLKLLLGLSWEKGEVVQNPISGQSAVCQSIARAIDTQKVVLEIPCAGDKTWGLVPDDELVAVVPFAVAEKILEGMRRSDAFVAYPFPPFLHWPAIFPPEFEPTGPELDKS